MGSKSRGANIWPGALREGLRQPDLVFLPTWQWCEVFLFYTYGFVATVWDPPHPSEQECIFSSSFWAHKIEIGWCDVTNDVTHSVGPSVTILPCYNFIRTQQILQLLFDGLLKHLHTLKIEIFAGADGKKDFVSFENLGTKVHACSMFFYSAFLQWNQTRC